MRWPWQTKPKVIVQHDIVIKHVPLEIPADWTEKELDQAMCDVFPKTTSNGYISEGLLHKPIVSKDRVPTGVTVNPDGQWSYAPKDGLPLVNQFRKELQNV